MSDAPDSMLVEFIRYNTWANQRLLQACESLSAEQLAAGALGTYGTVERTLEHLVDSEAFYFSLLTGGKLRPPFSWDDRPTVAQIRAYATVVGEAMIRAAGQVRPSDVLHEQPSIGTNSYKTITLLIQVVNHGVEHRTNITTILSALGLPAPAVDAWGYMQANRDRLGAE
jgi:uncharacterized damage-inducible protein DinB